VIDEDRPVVVGLGEAIGFRRQLVVVVVGLLGQTQRIEIGVQVAAHAEGADHHDGADGIARRLFRHCRIQRLSSLLGLALELVGDGLFDRTPVAVKRRDQLAIGLHRPVGLLPGCACSGFADLLRIVLQIGEEGVPLGGHAARIVLEPRIHVLDVVGVAAIQERGLRHDVVGFVVACHGSHLVSGPSPALSLDCQACAALTPRQAYPTRFPAPPCR
jgi:hypothetical protein